MFNENMSSGSPVLSRERTDGRTDVEILIGAVQEKMQIEMGVPYCV
jgi:hypothetical protein